MEQIVTSDFKLGIIAGGQLAKMLALAASNWDIKTFILDPDANCPAASICNGFTKGDYQDFKTVYEFGKQVNMVTFDIENVNTEALIQLKKEGIKIYPEPEVLSLIKDKGLQKEFYKKHNIPSPDFSIYDSAENIIKDIQENKRSLPFVQKLRTSGYDGKGVQVINDISDISKLMQGKSLTEKKVDIKQEIAIITSRNTKGQISSFPVVEMEFNSEANLVEKLICPSEISQDLQEKAKKLAEDIIIKLGMTGILAVEFFIDKQDNILVNEIAPRPHNSGHHTIESCITSQYEQHLRCILGFPLGSTSLKIPSVMINLLGEKNETGLVKYEGLTESMAIEGVKIHIYGKKETKPFRKMGHATILDLSIEKAKEKANKVKETLKIKSWK